MTYEQFKLYIDAIARDHALADQVSTASRGHICLMELTSCMGQLINLLSFIFRDEITDWIGYFCFELRFGRDYTPGKITDESGQDIPLANPYDLYQLLCGNWHCATTVACDQQV